MSLEIEAINDALRQRDVAYVSPTPNASTSSDMPIEMSATGQALRGTNMESRLWGKTVGRPLIVHTRGFHSVIECLDLRCTGGPAILLGRQGAGLGVARTTVRRVFVDGAFHGGAIRIMNHEHVRMADVSVRQHDDSPCLYIGSDKRLVEHGIDYEGPWQAEGADTCCHSLFENCAFSHAGNGPIIQIEPVATCVTFQNCTFGLTGAPRAAMQIGAEGRNFYGCVVFSECLFECTAANSLIRWLGYCQRKNFIAFRNCEVRLGGGCDELKTWEPSELYHQQACACGGSK